MPQLFTDSGGTDADRHSEAKRIIYDMGLSQYLEMMGPKERDFVKDQMSKFDRYGTRTLISVKTLFWLRDLKDKYV